MQYVLIIHHGTFPLPGTPEAQSLTLAEKKAVYADWAGLNATDNFTGAPPMGLPVNATTVRVENGVAVTTEGPFRDATSAVGGFAVVETEDLDGAIALASRVPQARLGGAVEVRPSVKYW